MLKSWLLISSALLFLLPLQAQLNTFPPGTGTGSISGDAWIVEETPTGAINGSNKDFTLAQTPSGGRVIVYLNGVRQKQSLDYTIVDNVITFASAPSTATPGVLVDYIYQTAPGTNNLSYIEYPIAACSDNTGGLMWNTPTGGAATAPSAQCNDTGAFQKPGASFSGTVDNAMEYFTILPGDLKSGANVEAIIDFATTASSPTGNVTWSVSTACRASGESWDGSFNTAQTVTVATGAQYATTRATIAALTMTSCTANKHMNILFSRVSSDTNNDAQIALKFRIKYPRNF